jgi:purine-binding chemotaxis protein CheW
MQATGLEQYIEFGIENERYAIRIQDIHEIIKIQSITEIPNVMPYVKGVIDLRGRVIPIISLRCMFNINEQSYSRTTRIIVVHHQEDTIGIIVDFVNKVARFNDIQPPPERVGGMEGNYFMGIGLTDSGLVGILKLDEILLRNKE